MNCNCCSSEHCISNTSDFQQKLCQMFPVSIRMQVSWFTIYGCCWQLSLIVWWFRAYWPPHWFFKVPDCAYDFPSIWCSLPLERPGWHLLWEHVWKPIGSLREHIGNNKNPTPTPSPKEKNPCPLDACCLTSLASRKFFTCLCSLQFLA